MILLDGKATAAAIRLQIKADLAKITSAAGRAPGLSVILVGKDPASLVYVGNKSKACEEVGIISTTHRLAADTAKDQLLELIESLNRNPKVDGILLQLPLPKELDSQRCLEQIHPSKDVDGFHPENMGKLVLGLPCFRPCTPAGVMTLLQRYGLSVAGKHAVVVGRSNIVGKPLALMLGAAGKAGNATVTVCHSATPNLATVCKEADFLFVAVGRPKYITADMVKENAVVVDVGINRTESGMVGDCDFAAISKKASAMTPVPGGVGPMTIAQLLLNTVEAFTMHEGLKYR